MIAPVSHYAAPTFSGRRRRRRRRFTLQTESFNRLSTLSAALRPRSLKNMCSPVVSHYSNYKRSYNTLSSFRSYLWNASNDGLYADARTRVERERSIRLGWIESRNAVDSSKIAGFITHRRSCSILWHCVIITVWLLRKRLRECARRHFCTFSLKILFCI